MASVPTHSKRRLIVCCDGTWMDADTGYVKPTLWEPIGKLQTPSNVTRISRALRRVCCDGSDQIIYYQSGVGSGGTAIDMITGGTFGRGIAENIRAAYAFICANYFDGDEIILVGFSRGAFTARSVAGMITELGLLTRGGMEFFYPIFKDMENFRTPGYHKKDPFPNTPFSNKPRGEHAREMYKQMCIERGLTRVHQDGGRGDLIKVRAVAVWETVGSLGIPDVSWLSKLGLPHPSKEYRFFDTSLSDRIEYAFQALALDERRPPFNATLWEKTKGNNNTTHLRQCWFPGNHGNIGGGWQDSGVANMSLAWMMDQLASIGVEFDEATIDRIWQRLLQYYREDVANVGAQSCGPNDNEAMLEQDPNVATQQTQAKEVAFSCGLLQPLFKTRPWAINSIYAPNHPVRPWALGAIFKVGGLYLLAGTQQRSVGMYKKKNPMTGADTSNFLENTNERIHSSVRVRLALRGLDLNDNGVWKAPSLTKNWRLKRTAKTMEGAGPASAATWEQPGAGAMSDEHKAAVLVSMQMQRHLTPPPDRRRAAGPGRTEGRRGKAPGGRRSSIKAGRAWVWEYCGPSPPPPSTTLPEEPLGPYERHLLRLAAGQPNVLNCAQEVIERGAVSGS